MIEIFTNKKEKLKNIEFLRFVFILILIYCHIGILLTNTFHDNTIYSFITNKSSFSVLVVDFFFILSGFFFKYSFNKKLDTFDFLKKKIIRLWPTVAFAVVCYICLRFFNIQSFGKNIYENLYSFFFVDNIGITLVHCGPTWYVSVLILVCLFYFYLYKAFSDKVANLIIGILVWFSYVFMINFDNGAICEHIKIANDFICLGLLRGIGGIGLGIFLYYTWQKYKDAIPDNNKIGYTLLEGGTLFWCVYSLIKSTSLIANQMVFIISFLILIFLFLIKKGYIAKFFNNNLSILLGRYSYSIFLTHIIFMYILLGTIWDINNRFIQAHAIISLISIYIICFIIGILTYHFIEKPNNKLYAKLGFLKYYIMIFLTMICVFALIGNILKYQKLSLNKTYLFNKNHINIQTKGLSPIESWGRWNNDNNIELKFYIPQKEDILIEFDVNPFLVDKKQTVLVYSNDKLLNTWIFDNTNSLKATIPIPKELISKRNRIKLKLNILNPKSPKELNLSEDERKLGLGLKSMTIKEGNK